MATTVAGLSLPVSSPVNLSTEKMSRCLPLTNLNLALAGDTRQLAAWHYLCAQSGAPVLAHPPERSLQMASYASLRYTITDQETVSRTDN